ncbi:MAG: hypothetical protein RSG95_02260 [Bacilli bacterium]
METISNFVINNYVWFLVIAIFLLLALIGYMVDVKKNKDDYPFKVKKDINDIDETNLSNIEITNNVALSEMINNNASVLHGLEDTTTKEETPVVLEAKEEEKIEDNNNI